MDSRYYRRIDTYVSLSHCLQLCHDISHFDYSRELLDDLPELLWQLPIARAASIYLEESELPKTQQSEDCKSFAKEFWAAAEGLGLTEAEDIGAALSNLNTGELTCGHHLH
jgi:hypothetical protein